ncbi:hypothetical protein I4U23_008164 [Adineta vaga]|nr:hypothetical protein I4U23_008164 [Adineta vaga]
MEKLENLTQTDINNGALIHMLAKAGITDVQEYVKNFHHETEELIIEEFQLSGGETIENTEQIIPPAEIQQWISGFRPNLSNSNQLSVLKEQEKQRKENTPEDIQNWIKRIRPQVDGVAQQTLLQQQEQLPKRNIPTDVNSWMQHMTPIGLHSSNEINTNVIPDTTITNDALSGNLSTWLTDWSKNLTEQPPPTSLDNWLQRLVPDNLHEPLTKANTAKGRLNTYLNAAQQVLSQHGYDVSTQAKPSSSSSSSSTGNVQVKSGRFGNVKQMYFLWKVLDKNNDRKITVEDIEIMLEEMGLNFVSKYVAKALFEMVDTDHDGVLQFRDFVALMGILKELIGAMGSAKA